MSRGWLCVFAKQPREGAVKTRMTPPLAPTEATELYDCMLRDVLEVTARAAPALGLEALLAVHPPPAVEALARRAPAPFRVVPQRGLGLAERMAWLLAEAGAADAWPVLLRGSDNPALSPLAMAGARDALDEVDLVIVPDLDGGYGLVGLRRPAPGVFDHPMSTDRVADDTLAAAAGLGLTARVLPGCFDLDTVGDLRRLAEARGDGCEGLCPRTLDYLDRNDLWRHMPPPPPAQPSSSG